jgi:tRNA G18 (ribose-2'-O)-methylase SpoU
VIEIDRDDDPRLQVYRHVAAPRWLLDRGVFVAEGRLVVERLLAHGGYRIDSILVTPTASHAIEARVTSGVPVYVAAQRTLDAITGFKFHRGCLAIVRRPEHTPLSRFASARTLVVLEGVGNPDNIGGIFRSAAALGGDGVVLDRACADPFYRKAMRTSMGAVLRLPFVTTETSRAAIAELKAMRFTAIGLSPDGRTTLDDLARELAPETRVAFVAGSEGPGLSADAAAAVDTTVRIPIDPDSDSLNVVVAVSIALQRLRRV